MQSADAKAATSSDITSSPILDKGLEKPASVIIVGSPSIMAENPLLEMDKLRKTRANWNQQLYVTVQERLVGLVR